MQKPQDPREHIPPEMLHADELQPSDFIEPEMIFTEADSDRLLHQLDNEIYRRMRRRVWTSIAAALIPVAVVVGFFAFKYESKSRDYDNVMAWNIEISTACGESSNTTLPDGSVICLGPDSHLSYSPASFNDQTREIRYIGEGRFSIAHNPDVPFILKSATIEITVHGTEFAIMSRDGDQQSEICLEEGSITLNSIKSGEKIPMTPGETAFVNHGTGKIEIVDNSQRSRIAVGNHVTYFNTAALPEVGAALKRYYGYTLRFDEELSGVCFTGSIPTNNLDQALYIIESALAVRALPDDDRIITLVPASK